MEIHTFNKTRSDRAVMFKYDTRMYDQARHMHFRGVSFIVENLEEWDL